MKKPRRCSRCKELGHRADRCSLISLPEALDRQAGVVPTIDLDRKKRFEEIEARAKARQGG